LTQANRFNAATSGTKVGYTDYAYDSGSRLTSEIHRNTGGTALVTYVNAYDTADRITTETRNGTATPYSYDVNSQLTNDGTTAYTFDSNGNRTGGSYTAGTANRMTNDGTWTYSYDLEGNLTKKSKGASLETWNYTYDLRNQLTKAEKHATDGGTLQQQVDYKYDVYGNLVDRNVTVSGATHTKTAYEIVDPSPGITGSVNVAWADLDSGGSLTTRYVPGDRQGEKIARSTTSTDYWLLADRQGSLREVTSSSGAIVDEVSYTGFGIATETDNTKTGSYTFTGFYQDPVADISISATRFYNTGTGQWGQEDPWGLRAGDGNTRRYSGNSPTVFTDLSGLEKTKDPPFEWNQELRGTNQSGCVLRFRRDMHTFKDDQAKDVADNTARIVKLLTRFVDDLTTLKAKPVEQKRKDGLAQDIILWYMSKHDTSIDWDAYKEVEEKLLSQSTTLLDKLKSEQTHIYFENVPNLKLPGYPPVLAISIFPGTPYWIKFHATDYWELPNHLRMSKLLHEYTHSFLSYQDLAWVTKEDPTKYAKPDPKGNWSEVPLSRKDRLNNSYTLEDFLRQHYSSGYYP
jgi:RHS repeat-associated protein